MYQKSACTVADCEDGQLKRAEPMPSLRTVDRALVHKQAIADVFLTGSVALPNGEYVIAGQWPRRHWHFGEPAVRLEPLLVAETLRQACLYLGFTHLGVPDDSHLLIEQLSVRQLMPRLPTPTPVDLSIRVEIVGGGAGGGGTSLVARRLPLRTEFRYRETTVAIASGVARVLPPQAYARLRLRRPAENDRRTSHERTLRVDRSHPVYFDHPSDHVPGLLLVEEALRSSRSASLSGWHPVTFSANFNDFVELDTPATLSVVFDRRVGRWLRRRTVRVIQFDRAAVEVTAEFRALGARGR